MVAQRPAKSFLYLSEKIETLFAQLPLQNREDRDAALPDRASAVCEHLAKQPGLVGTVDAPLAYFQGELEMHVSSLSPFGSTELIALSGETEKTCLALVGASSCVVADIALNPLGLGVLLYRYLAECGERLSDDRWSDGSGCLSPGIEKSCRGGNLWLYFRAVASAYRRAPARGAPVQGRGIPTRNVEFVARSIDRREVEGLTFLVGSPLYVAVNDGTVLPPRSSTTSFTRLPFVVEGS